MYDGSLIQQTALYSTMKFKDTGDKPQKNTATAMPCMYVEKHDHSNSLGLE